jgi:hypothetical protein
MSAICANLWSSQPVLRADGTAPIHRDGENTHVSLSRIAWLITVLACLVTAGILLLQGYYGYAGVTFAVALSAAINLT